MLPRTLALAGGLFFATVAFSQSQVTGTIVDSHNEPIIGASVSIKGTTVGTVSDTNGNFRLDAKKGDIITFSYIGFKNIEQSVSKNQMAIVMTEDAQLLNEVIATGYGAVSRKNLTTSIAKVKADDVVKTGTTNVSQMLMGRAAGLQATIASAQPGGGVSMTIRGGGKPLYVVDGVVMPSASLESNSGGSTTVMPSSVNRSALSGLNPEDIESIEVLKDASAAIYGINAANGVILITTKKGKKGHMNITYDGAMSLVSNYPYIDPLNAQDFMTYSNLYKKELYLYNNKMGVYGPNTYDGKNTDAFTPEQIAAAKNTNWRDEILRKGSISSYNVTINGGSDKLTYYLSGNYYRQIGTVQNSGYQRLVLRSNVSAQLFDFLKLTTMINYNKNNNNNGTVGGTSNGRGEQAEGSLTAALSYPTYLPIYDTDGKYTTYSNIPNAVGMLKMTDRTRSEGFQANFAFDIDIIKNMLSARLLYGYNSESSERSVYIPSDVFFDQMFRSRGSLQNAFRNNNTMEATLSYQDSFLNNALNVNATVGMGRYLNHTKGLGISYTDINDVIGNDNVAASTGDYKPSSYRTSDEKRSQFGRVSLDLLDRYVLSGTLRRDGTDKFFKDKKYAWFPSVAVAWKIFNEDFMKDVRWVNMLKLRASYGVTGNDNLGTTLYGAYSSMHNHVMFSNNSSNYVPYYLVSSDYPNVTWEKTKMKNVGLDFSVLGDRINGSFDYFCNDVTNLLGSANSEGLSMFDKYPVNGGHIRRYGWDATINTVNITRLGFKWTSMLTLSHYNSIWKERFSNYDYREYQVRKDEPVNALYFYRTDGIINSDLSNCPSSQPDDFRIPGYPVIKDLDGDGTITVKDVDMVNVIPTLYWGLGNTFTYKNWDLNIFVYSQLGLKKYNYAYDWTDVRNLGTQAFNQATIIKDCYHSEVNPKGCLPGMAFRMIDKSLPGGAGTDIYYENADFVRVRNITLGYNFNSANLGALRNYVRSIRLYVDLQNPFTFTSYKYFDPEVVTGGSYKGGKAEYPMIRTYSVGAKIQF